MAKPKEVPAAEPLTVQATKKGYFGHRIVKVGEVFRVPQAAFSKHWMKLTKKKPVEDLDEEEEATEENTKPSDEAVL